MSVPPITLTAPDGARAEVLDRGGQVIGWTPAGGGERLFFAPRSEYGPGPAFRGGVPVIWPQFGGFGPLIGHGFARDLPFELIEGGAAGALARGVWRTTDTPDTRSVWDFPFILTVTVEVGGPRLVVRLAASNVGERPFTFTAALHTYLRVADLAQTTLEGLGGLRYRDHANGDVYTRQTEPTLRFTGEVDRIYGDAPPRLRLVEPGRTLTMLAENFPDAVVWTPWDSPRGITNPEPGGSRRYLCVEAATITAPVTLAPGGTWRAAQILIAD